MLLRKESHALHLVIINGVAVQLAQLGIGAHHQAMVTAHGFHRSHAGQHSLAATAKATKEMVHNGARHDN